MIDMVGANATLANGGMRATPYAAIEIRNSAGKVDLHARRQRRAAGPRAAGRQGRRDEQHHDPCRDRGHRARRADSRASSSPARPARPTTRPTPGSTPSPAIWSAASGSATTTTRRWRNMTGGTLPAHDLARDHGFRAPGSRDQAALRRAAACADAQIAAAPAAKGGAGIVEAPRAARPVAEVGAHAILEIGDLRALGAKSTAPSRPRSVRVRRRRRHRHRPRRRGFAVASRLTSRVELAIFAPRLGSVRRRAGAGLAT